MGGGHPEYLSPTKSVKQDRSPGQISLDDHLRQAIEDRKREEEKERLRLKDSGLPETDGPITPAIDPLFLHSPYGLNEPTRAVESARANAAKRDRELSATKRAAQNRAAQRAFRQRKEGHIQELEQQVTRCKALGDAHKLLQIENHQLREYISALQSTLIEFRIEIPSPPHGLELLGDHVTIPVETYGLPKTSLSVGQPPRAANTASAKRKAQASAPSSSAKATTAGPEKRQQIDPLPAFGPVTIGLRASEQENAIDSNIEPRLMNA